MKPEQPLTFDHTESDDIYNETEPPVTTVKPKPKPKPKKPVAKKVSNKQNKHVALENCFNDRLNDGFDFDKYLSCIREFQGHIKPTTAFPFDNGESKPRKSKGSAKKISYDGGFGDGSFGDGGFGDGGFVNVGYGGNGGFTDIEDSEDSGEVMQFYDRASDIFQMI